MERTNDDVWYEDKIVTCLDCGDGFSWTGPNQKYYAEMGWGEPIRCPACRHSRRLYREDRLQRSEQDGVK
jgi:DNA-directed RNA polymerase subunit RPC12/RpoP